MASIVHIPFNFAPINTGSTTSTYTVPSGKYALVKLKNCSSPVLNSVDFFESESFTIGFGMTPSTAWPLYLPRNVDTLTINMTSPGPDILYVGFNPTPSAQDKLYTYTVPTGSSNFTINLKSINKSPLYLLCTSGSLVINSITIKFNDVEEIWLKTGDILSFSNGSVHYIEYNNIS